MLRECTDSQSAIVINRTPSTPVAEEFSPQNLDSLMVASITSSIKLLRLAAKNNGHELPSLDAPGHGNFRASCILQDSCPQVSCFAFELRTNLDQFLTQATRDFLPNIFTVKAFHVLANLPFVHLKELPHTNGTPE